MELHLACLARPLPDQLLLYLQLLPHLQLLLLLPHRVRAAHRVVERPRFSVLPAELSRLLRSHFNDSTSYIMPLLHVLTLRPSLAYLV
jgi:hypothetical protein